MTQHHIADPSLRAAVRAARQRLLVILSRPTLLVAALEHARLMLEILERREGR